MLTFILKSSLFSQFSHQLGKIEIYVKHFQPTSAGALGVVLCQIDPIDKKSHPCAYGSRKFNASELKLSIPCKELLAIVYGLNLRKYLKVLLHYTL